MNSNAVFWGIWKFALSLAVLWFVAEVGLGSFAAIQASKRRARIDSLREQTPPTRTMTDSELDAWAEKNRREVTEMLRHK